MAFPKGACAFDFVCDDDFEELARFLDLGGDDVLHSVDPLGQSLLHVAAQSNRLQCAGVLLQRGQECDTASGDPLRPVAQVPA